MSIHESAGGIGDWEIKLLPDTPKRILDALDYFGHVFVTSAPMDMERFGDNIPAVARYGGVLRNRELGGDDKSIGGPGMSLWLGDEDNKGDVIESPITITSQTMGNAINAVLPASVHLGQVEAVSGTYSGVHQYETRRNSIDYISGLFGAEWRLNYTGLIDVGTPGYLYPAEPTCAIVRRIPEGGIDMEQRALPGEAKLKADMEDFTTRVFLVTQPPEGGTPATASADIAPGKNPYKDLFGNPVKLTRLISDSQTTAENAPSVAQLQLNRFTKPKEAITLSTETHDIKGDLVLGGYIWVEDEDAKLVDLNTQIKFKGMTLNPVKLRVTALAYPVEKGMGVGFRHWNGTWYDLTQYVDWESGDTTVEVDGYYRSLTGAGSFQDPINSVSPIDTTIPNPPAFVTPFLGSTYSAPSDGRTRAQVELKWSTPLNTDDSAITDGARYEVRYRTSAEGLYPSTYDELKAYTNAQLIGTNNSPIPFTNGAWSFLQTSWGINTFLLDDLDPGIPYEYQVRAVDNYTPAHFSDWSASLFSQTRPDTQAPDAPDAFTVAANRLAVQVKSLLGAAGSGGTFNLNSDLNHLNVYMGNEPTFDCSDKSMKIGEIPANISSLKSQSPAIRTFNIDNLESCWFKITAVDNFGNESLPSVGVQQTALLVDDAHISNLTVSKVEAGFVNAMWIQGGDFTTAMSGNRSGFNYAGFYAYDNQNHKTFDVSSATGNVTIIGKFIASDPINNPGDSITMWPSYPGVSFPTIEFVSSDAGVNTSPAFINALPGFGGNGTALGLNSGWSAALPTNNQSTLILGGQGYYLQYNSANPVPNDPRGARLYGDITYASMEHWNNSGVNNSYVDVKEGQIYMFAGNAGLERAHFQLGAGASGDSNWGRNGSENAGNGACGIELIANGIRMYSAGIYVFATRYSGDTSNSYTESFQFSGFGASNFRGQLGGSGNFGKSFSVRTTSGDANAILDVDGKTSVFVKNFVIDHPEDADRWLVHACTEGPTAGVEYSGKVEINNWVATVTLPPYFEAATRPENRQIFLTVQLPEDGSLYPYIPRAIPGPIVNGQFKISSDGLDGTIVAWLVKAVRSDVEQFPVTPLKAEWARAGNGPYTFLEKK